MWGGLAASPVRHLQPAGLAWPLSKKTEQRQKKEHTMSKPTAFPLDESRLPFEIPRTSRTARKLPGWAR